MCSQPAMMCCLQLYVSWLPYILAAFQEATWFQVPNKIPSSKKAPFTIHSLYSTIRFLVELSCIVGLEECLCCTAFVAQELNPLALESL
jgi:hypothetical protein